MHFQLRFWIEFCRKRLVPDERLLPDFLRYFIRGSQKNLLLDWRKQGATVESIEQENLGNSVLPLPPVAEQRHVVSYLDRKTAQIDTLIQKKQALIGLLREQRTALINRAVTKGLDPTMPMRDSGIAWLGEVPEHWNITRFKYLYSNIEQGWSPSCEGRLAEPEEWGVLKVGCVNGQYFNESEHKALPAELDPKPELEVHPGDLLMSRANTRELVGSVSLVGAIRPRLLLCDKLYRIALNPDVDARFVAHFLSAPATRLQVEQATSGASSSMQNISQEIVSELLIAVPPKNEQAEVANYVGAVSARIEAIISREEALLDRLGAFRTSLISEVVTGKIDVRNSGVAAEEGPGEGIAA